MMNRQIHFGTAYKSPDTPTVSRQNSIRRRPSSYGELREAPNDDTGITYLYTGPEADRYDKAHQLFRAAENKDKNLLPGSYQLENAEETATAILDKLESEAKVLPARSAPR